MEVKEAVEEIRHYFNLDLVPHSRTRLERILQNVSHERIVTKIKEVVVYPTESDIPIVEFNEEAIRIAKLYNTTLQDMQSKKRHKNIVCARAHFSRYVRLHSNYTTVAIGRFLRRHHSSILHLLYDANIPCAISPLYRKKYIKCHT